MYLIASPPRMVGGLVRVGEGSMLPTEASGDATSSDLLDIAMTAGRPPRFG